MIEYSSEVVDATQVAKDSYIEMSKYTARTRTYHNMIDGLKSVYRRVIYSSLGFTSAVKSATIVGRAMTYHPHGDSSVYSALVEMTSKFSNNYQLYDGEGNWGGMGFGPAAMRYTEATLSKLGRLLINEDLIPYCDYVEGDAGYQEPVSLPMLIPYVLLVGGGGFGVGMPNPYIPSYDIMDIIKYYRDLMTNTPISSYPRVDVGDCIMWVNDMSEQYNPALLGGKVYYEGIVEREGPTRFVINTIPPERSKDDILKKVQSYLDAELLSFIDESDSKIRYVFEVENINKLDPELVYKKLKQGLRCSTTYKLLFELNSKVYESSIINCIKLNLKYNSECVVRKYTSKLESSEKLSQVLRAIEEMKQCDEIMKNITSLTSDMLIVKIMSSLPSEWSEDIAKEVVKKPISYLTKSHLAELEKLREDMKISRKYINSPYTYLQERFDELEEIVKVEYNSKKHTTITTDPDSIVSLRKGKITSEGFSVVGKGCRSNITWDTYINIIDNSGVCHTKYINTRVPETYSKSDLSIDSIVGACSDSDKYLVLIENDKWIYVVDTRALSDMSLVLTKASDDTKLVADGTKLDNIRIIGNDGSVSEYELKSFCKSRRSMSSSVKQSSKGIKSYEFY